MARKPRMKVDLMITNSEDFDESPPPRIYPAAIDLAIAEDSEGSHQVVLRIYDAETGARIDIVIPSRKLASEFGLSLQEFASTVML
jgi:hypothetical protein